MLSIKIETRIRFNSLANLVVGLAFVTAVPLAKGDWRVVEQSNPLGPGKAVDVLQDGKAVARLVHGEGQIKPFLHIFGSGGELVTNPGLDREGKGAGLFNHHRGIFIGWNKVSSELGNYDMWHKGGPGNGRYDIVKFENKTTKNSASIVAHIKWRATQKDAIGSDVMISERRTFNVSRPGGIYTQVDASFELKAERDVSLAGDLQHAGVHFRAHTEVATRNKETSYLWEPANAAGKGRVIDGNHQWARLLFPIGKRWYTAQEMNAPANGVKELSWRDYGRFGYFLPKQLKKGEPFNLKFRFAIEEVDGQANVPKPSEAHAKASHKLCTKRYKAFLKSLNNN
ncbi:MAG: PmoA family protein [Verrucomicrobiota bacterium]|nr:PmoA family protein [Verrucomicrobiota bacterium]